MNFLQKGSTEEMQIVEGESDEESVDFSPINEEVWFSSSNSALEVIPHNDVGMHASINRSKRKSYGSPVGQDISTRHVSGKKIDKKHTQFALSAGMMLGVRECVGGLSSLSENDDYNESSPNEKEFTHVEKIKIPAGAYFISNEMSSLPYRYNFKAYAPTIFSNIRAMAGVDKQRFLHSICGNDAFIEFVSNAKSGQFFFYSHDGR
jgi:1-phosphatidylinositol-4-phosphate 5-kinase